MPFGRSPVGILGIGTALPAFCARQDEILAALHPELEPGSPLARLARTIFRNACIEERHSCIPDFTGRGKPVLFLEPDRDPGMTRRMTVYQREAPRLATEAAERALKHARVLPDEITHLVVATCTGTFTPGPDVELASQLSLRPDVERTAVAFMGCSGAFHALRVARRAAGDAVDARVLLVCVELCSLHYRREAAPEKLVAHSLFADGAAAVVLGSASADLLLELGPAITHLEPNSRDALRWDLRDDHFEIQLSRRLPAILEAGVDNFVSRLLRRGEPPRDLAWIVHPGGAAILRAIERALDLRARELSSAWATLRRLGNTSSAAVLYTAAEALPALRQGTEGILLGFGPGLTLEAVRFRRGSAAP